MYTSSCIRFTNIFHYLFIVFDLKPKSSHTFYGHYICQEKIKNIDHIHL